MEDIKLLPTIHERNRVRAAAGLPLLEVRSEEMRPAAAKRYADFEHYYWQNRDRIAGLWADRGQGWLTRAGIWAAARLQLRLEFDAIDAK